MLPDPVAWSSGDRGAHGWEGPAGCPVLGEHVLQVGGARFGDWRLHVGQGGEGGGESEAGVKPGQTVLSNLRCSSCHFQDLGVFNPGPPDNVKLSEPPRSSMTN